MEWEFHSPSGHLPFCGYTFFRKRTGASFHNESTAFFLSVFSTSPFVAYFIRCVKLFVCSFAALRGVASHFKVNV
jgi:hypothetical protein